MANLIYTVLVMVVALKNAVVVWRNKRLGRHVETEEERRLGMTKWIRD
jgi:hypothetical protein